MKKLELSTKKSIHPPVEVVVDGKTYVNNPLSHALFDELKKHEKAALGGDPQALYAQVRAIYNIPVEKLHKLDMRDIRTLLEYTMKETFGEPEERTEAEKEEKKD